MAMMFISVVTRANSEDESENIKVDKCTQIQLLDISQKGDLVFGCSNSVVYFYSIPKKQFLKKWHIKKPGPTTLALSDDGALLGIGTHEGVKLVQPTKSKQIELEQVAGHVNAIEFLKGNAYIVASVDSQLVVWNSNTGEILHRFDVSETKYRKKIMVDNIATAIDSIGDANILVGMLDGTVKKIELNTETMLTLEGFTDRIIEASPVWQIRVSKQNRKAIVAKTNGESCIVDLDGFNVADKFSAPKANLFSLRTDEHFVLHLLQSLKGELFTWNKRTGDLSKLKGLRSPATWYGGADDVIGVSRNNIHIWSTVKRKRDLLVSAEEIDLFTTAGKESDADSSTGFARKVPRPIHQNVESESISSDLPNIKSQWVFKMRNILIIGFCVILLAIGLLSWFFIKR